MTFQQDKKCGICSCGFTHYMLVLGSHALAALEAEKKKLVDDLAALQVYVSCWP